MRWAFFPLCALCLLPGSLWAAEKDITIEEFLQGLSTVPGVVGRKDPFIEAKAPFAAVQRADGEIVQSAPVLERYPLAYYTVVATLLGDQYPRALVRLPDTEGSQVLIVKEKDRLGNRSGIIAQILSDSVRVVERQRSPHGFVDKAEVNLKVGTTELKGAGATNPPSQ